MSANADQARQLAQRIAARLDTGSSGGASNDVAGLRSTLSEISRRLDRIEARIAPGSSSGAYSPWTPPNALHPSQEKFDVEEATVAEMVDYFESTKKCDLEPGNKPCDHCSMCSSRGF